MYLPINTNGYFVFTQSAESAGWYQLDMAGAVLPVPLDIQFFGQRTGQGGGWAGTMDGLLIQ